MENNRKSYLSGSSNNLPQPHLQATQVIKLAKEGKFFEKELVVVETGKYETKLAD